MKKYLLFAAMSLVLFSCGKEKKQDAAPVEEEKQLVFGRQVPERLDDFTWENDRMAYRVYGPALAADGQNPSNGVDIWLKKTEDLIVDKFYKDELEGGLSYHVDRGLGLDCYKVGHTLGAGGIATFVDGQIAVEGNYTTAEVLSMTPANLTFQLTYDNVKSGDKVLTKKVIVSLDAGSQMNKATVSYDGDFETLELAAGIFIHDGSGVQLIDQENGFLAYAEDAVSDAGVPAGRNYVGVIFTTPVTAVFTDDVHMAGIVNYTKGEELVYYFGGGWSEWGFDTDDAWFDYVKNFQK